MEKNIHETLITKEELNKSIEYRDYYKINFDNRDVV